MTKINYHSLHLIDKLATLRQAAKDVERDYIENEKRFKVLVDSIDNGIDDYGTFQDKMAALNVVLSKSDELLQQITIINEMVIETRAQLTN